MYHCTTLQYLYLGASFPDALVVLRRRAILFDERLYVWRRLLAEPVSAFPPCESRDSQARSVFRVEVELAQYGFDGVLFGFVRRVDPPLRRRCAQARLSIVVERSKSWLRLSLLFDETFRFLRGSLFGCCCSLW